jgi:hypothetical protein
LKKAWLLHYKFRVLSCLSSESSFEEQLIERKLACHQFLQPLRRQVTLKALRVKQKFNEPKIFQILSLFQVIFKLM